MLSVLDGCKRMALRAKRGIGNSPNLGDSGATGEGNLTIAEYRALQSMHPAFRGAFERACSEGRASYAYARRQHEEHLSLIRARCYSEAEEVGRLINEMEEDLHIPLARKIHDKMVHLRAVIS